MTFTETLLTLSDKELENILNIIGINVLHKKSKNWTISCPSGDKKCSELQRCSFFLDSANIVCLDTAHDKYNVWDLLIKAGVQKPFELVTNKNYNTDNTKKIEYREHEKTEREEKNYLSEVALQQLKYDVLENYKRLIELIKIREFTEEDIYFLLDYELIWYLTKEYKKTFLHMKNASEKIYEIGFLVRDKIGINGFSMWIGDNEPNPQKFKPKYKYSKGSSNIIFDCILNENDENKRLFVVEGVFDLLRLLCKFNQEEHQLPYAIASVPANTDITKLYMYEKSESIFIFGDQDKAGKDLFIKNVNLIKNKKIYIASWLYNDYQAKGLDDFLKKHSLKELKEKIQRVR